MLLRPYVCIVYAPAGGSITNNPGAGTGNGGAPYNSTTVTLTFEA